MNKFALFLIKLYQRYLSPRKGYCCAYASLYNNGSCSERVSNIINDHGVIYGWSEIRHQFILCSEAYEIIKEKNKKKKDSNDGCSPADACEIVNCIPISKLPCKGRPTDGDCDLPCDCSPF